MEKRRSPGALIGDALAGVGDALNVQADKGNPGFLSKSLGAQGEKEKEAMSNFDTQRQMKMQNEGRDPTSAYSRAKQASIRPFALAAGFTDKDLANISGEDADGIMKSSTNAMEAKNRLIELKNQNSFMNQFHQGELANTSEKNKADTANQETERRISALKDLPWYSGIEPDWLKSDKIKALEREAGILPKSDSNVLTATNPKTGHKVTSTDGGKTWQ
jgi:hypothetical protein